MSAEVYQIYFQNGELDLNRSTLPSNTACEFSSRALKIVVPENMKWQFKLYFSGDSEYENQLKTDLNLQAGASLDWVLEQQESSSAVFDHAISVNLHANTLFYSHQFDCGAKQASTKLDVRLLEEQASCILDGLYRIDGSRTVSNDIDIEHVVPNCSSEQFYKGIVSDRSHAKFRGKVVVQEGADQSDAKQQNHNLLLSEFAQVDTKPELEIYADDVSCSHGATVGQLDENMLFYLVSRGIPRDEAKSLLVEGFGKEVIDRVF